VDNSVKMAYYTLYEMDLGFPQGALSDINPAEFPEVTFMPFAPETGTRLSSDPAALKPKSWQIGPGRKGLEGLPTQRLPITALKIPVEDPNNLTDEEKNTLNSVTERIYDKYENRKHPGYDKDNPTAAYEGDMELMRKLMRVKYDEENEAERLRQEPLAVLGDEIRASAATLRKIREFTNSGKYLDIKVATDSSAWLGIDDANEKDAIDSSLTIPIPIDKEYYRALGKDIMGAMLDRNMFRILGGTITSAALFPWSMREQAMRGQKRIYDTSKGLFRKKGTSIFRSRLKGAVPKKGDAQMTNNFLLKSQVDKNLFGKIGGFRDKFLALGQSSSQTQNLMFNNSVIYGLGSGLGDMVYSAAENAYRTYRGIERAEKDVPDYLHALNGTAEGVVYGTAGHYAMELFRAIGPALKKALFTGDPKRLERLVDIADKHGVSAGLVAVSDKTWVQKFPTVLGKFPLIGGAFVKQAERTYPQIQSQAKHIFNMLTPYAHLNRMSGGVEKLIRSNKNNILKLSQSSANRFYQKAALLPEGPMKQFVPTTNIKQYAKQHRTKIENLPEGMGLKEEYGVKSGIAADKDDFITLLLNLGKKTEVQKWNINEYVAMKTHLHQLGAHGGLNKAQESTLEGILTALEADMGMLSKPWFKGQGKIAIQADPALANHRFRYEGKDLVGAPAVEAQMLDVYNSGLVYTRLQGNALEKFFKSSQAKAYEKLPGDYKSTSDFIAKKNTLHGKEYHKEFVKDFLALPTAGSARAARLILGNNKEGADMMSRLLNQKINKALEDSFVTKGVVQRESARRAATFVEQSKIPGMPKQLEKGITVGDPQIKMLDVDGFIKKMGLNTKDGKIAFQQMMIDSRTPVLGLRPSGKIKGERYLAGDVLEESTDNIDKFKLGKIKGLKGKEVTVGQHLKDIDEFFEIVRRVNNVSVEDASKFIQRRAVFSGAQAIGTGVIVGSSIASSGLATPLLFALTSRAFGKLITNPTALREWSRTMNMDERSFTDYWKHSRNRQLFGDMLKIYTPGAEIIPPDAEGIIRAPSQQREEWEGTIDNIIKRKDFRKKDLLQLEKLLWEGNSMKPESDEEMNNLSMFLHKEIEGTRNNFLRETARKLEPEDLVAQDRPELISEGRFRPKETPMGEQRPFYPKTPETPPVLRGATGQSSIAPGTYSALFPQDTLGAGITQQRQMAQGPQRTSLMASGGIALATPAAELSGKVFETQAAKNIMSTFWGTPMQQTVQNLLLTGTAKAKEKDPRPEGQVKLSTLYDPQGRWTGAGPEPRNISTPKGQEAWFTPSKPTTLGSQYDPHTGAWIGTGAAPSFDPYGGGGPGRSSTQTYYGPGKVTYEDIGPVYSSASAITQQDPSRYRVAGLKEGGILSTRSAKQMVA